MANECPKGAGEITCMLKCSESYRSMYVLRKYEKDLHSGTQEYTAVPTIQNKKDFRTTGWISWLLIDCTSSGKVFACGRRVYSIWKVVMQVAFHSRYVKLKFGTIIVLGIFSMTFVIRWIQESKYPPDSLKEGWKGNACTVGLLKHMYYHPDQEDEDCGHPFFPRDITPMLARTTTVTSNCQGE